MNSRLLSTAMNRLLLLILHLVSIGLLRAHTCAADIVVSSATPSGTLAAVEAAAAARRPADPTEAVRESNQ